MKALSLWQPWASAIALGLKRVETRHWSSRYRGLIVIHAAKRWTADERDLAWAHGIDDPPLGALVAIASLVDIIPTERVMHLVGSQELAWGNYAAGRFAWLLDDIKPLAEPIPYRGAQGLFNVPDALVVPA